MWLVAPLTPSRKTPIGPLVLFDVFTVERSRVRLVSTGEVVVGAYVPDDAPEAARVRARALEMPGRRIVEDAEVEAADNRPTPARPPSEATTRDRLFEVAFRNGWDADDLADTWDGTPDGDRGNRSVVTGLALLEMAQTKAPSDWSRLREMNEPPWSSSTWKPPHVAWTPPIWTRPSKIEEPPPAPPPPPAPADDDDEALTEVMDAAAVDQDGPTVISVDAPTDAAEGELDEAAPPYPAESIDNARAALRALALEINREPVLGRANSRLTKLGLPRIPNTDTLNWLLKPQD